MYNYFMLIGKVEEILATEANGRKLVRLCLAIKRPFRNADGEFETDFIAIFCYEYLADIVVEQLSNGDTVSVKGHLVTEIGRLKAIADRIMILGSEAR